MIFLQRCGGPCRRAMHETLGVQAPPCDALIKLLDVWLIALWRLCLSNMGHCYIKLFELLMYKQMHSELIHVNLRITGGITFPEFILRAVVIAVDDLDRIAVCEGHPTGHHFIQADTLYH